MIGNQIMTSQGITEIGRCRGNGKVYLLFNYVRQEEPVVSSMTANGNPTPNLITRLSKSEVIITVSDIATTQLITFLEDSHAISTFKVKPLESLVASRYNGIAHKSLCAKIRNINHFGTKCPAFISCSTLIPREKGMIIRGSVYGLFNSKDMSLAALDSKGRLIGTGCFLYPELSSTRTNEFSLFVTSLATQTTICLVEHDGSFSDIFYVLQPNEIKNLRENVKSQFVNAYDDPEYERWFANNCLTKVEAEMQRTVAHRDFKFSIIVPLYKTPLGFLEEMVDSVIGQTYPEWELVLVNSTPEIKELKERVWHYAHKEPRITVIELDKNYGITENTNAGIKVATGDYVCFFDHDDVLEPDILFEYAKAIEAHPDVDLLYCDEDKLLPNGHYANPTFKPDFNLDMTRDNNYVCHLLTVRKDALASVRQSDASLDGAQDHAMVLKIAELGGYIHHVPKILYHWRISETSTAGNSDSKPYASIAGIKAVQEHLDRVGIDATVVSSHDRAFRYRPLYRVPDDTHITIVAPISNTDTAPKLLEALAITDADNWDLIVVCAETNMLAISALRRISPLANRITIVTKNGSFNYAQWANSGASSATGNCLAFIREDIEPQNKDWLTNLAGLAIQPGVGAVGTMTCDPDGVIRQAGLAYVNDQIIPLSKGIFSDSFGYILFPLTTRDVAAIDGACIVTSKAVFNTIGGFNEDYSTAYEDIDYCFKANAHGLRIAYTPESKLICTAPEQTQPSTLDLLDKALFVSNWSEQLSVPDRYFNPNFSKRADLACLYKLDH